MTTSKRILAALLSLALLLTFLPAGVFSADDDIDDDIYTMDNGYIQVSVSGKNGGFLVNTTQGNLLKKSDNNKDLLYRSDEFDTSFVSFRVGSGAEAREYLFGGTYENSSDVVVSQQAEGGDIAAVWSVDGITFTQTISLAQETASEHGMVSIALAAQNDSGAAVPIRARILLDTCLGDQDYAYYQTNGGSLTNTLQTEQIITDEAALMSFYAVDDVADPTVTAYAVSQPYQAAIGHWNNLASSLFDFAPDTSLTFTNPINDYLTADSACALYYDLGTVENGSSGSVVSYYGVYSNHTVSLENRMAVNTVAPLRLELNEDKSAYVRLSEVGIADFAVTVSAENFKSNSSVDLENVIMAVRSTSGLRSLSDNGEGMNGYDYDTTAPLTIPYGTVREGQTITKTLYFQAQSPVSASYERITIGMYTDSVTQENLLGEKLVYLLLPGSDGNIPQVSFTSMTPTTIYSSGTRHLYVSVTNPVILENALSQGICAFKAYSADGKTVVDIPAESITISDGVADVALGEDIKLALGSWYLQLEWTDDAVSNGIVTAEFQKQTASVLEFAVSDDPKFKNDCYGVLAAVKYEDGSGSQHTYTYRLESFQDEAAFKAFENASNPAWKEILLVYRGEFTGDNRYPVKDETGKIIGYRYYTAVSKKSVDEATRVTTVDNLITINNCVDFEGGTISVYYEDYANVNQDRAMESPILTEFDGDLYTSDARSSIWTGKAALTKLEQGKNFALLHYDKDGNRKASTATPITLIWPNVWSYAQTLAGMVFKLAYGQFGVMELPNGQVVGRTIGFSASLSIPITKSPDPEDDTAAPDTYFGKMKELWKDWRGASIYQYAYHGDRFEKLTTIDMNDSTTDHNDALVGVQTSVMVKDILFGCGEGFVGMNFSVDVTVRNLVEDMPKVQGKLSINTINNWSVALEGSCKFTDKMKMEAKLSFKSYENIPVPDDFYFYIGGFKPGLNVDGAGVVWITGGGGGFSHLYDTIFCTSGLPPLKLILAISFSIIQVLDGDAKLEMSLSGLQLTASNLKIQDTIEVIKKIQLGLQWYPDLKLQAGIYVKMFEGVLDGQGYIILLGKDYTDWFFEMFVRAQLRIPESVPGVGGMTILGVDLGINTEKIWGAFTALCINIGVSYYWGEDSVNFDSGGDRAKPTFPDLLLSAYTGECNDFPIAHDDERGRTLYAHFGTNFEAPRGAQVLSESDLRLMATSGVWSNEAKTSHKFNLGIYNDSNNAAAMVQLNFVAESLAEAQALAQGFTVSDAANTSLPLSFYDGTNSDTANANVTWDSETKTAVLVFTVTDEAHYNKDWYFQTGTTAADVVLYNILPMPELTEVSTDATISAGSDVDVTWFGSGLDELDSISFFLCSSTDPTVDAGYPLTYQSDPWDMHSVNGITDTNVIQNGIFTFRVPAGIPAGSYYLRAVYAKSDQLNGIIHSAGTFTVTNPNTPAAMGEPTVTPAGDHKFGVSIPATGDQNTSGYLVTVYNADGTETDINGSRFDKAETGATSFEIGGSYVTAIREDESDPDSAEIGTERHGLEGGKQYVLSVTPYKTVDTDGDGEDDAIVYGTEQRTSAITLPEAITPTTTLNAKGKTFLEVRTLSDNVHPPVFTNGALNVEASFSEAVSGYWTLDGGTLWEKAEDAVVAGTFDSTANATFVLPELTDGDHMLSVTGKAADGDSFSYSYPFTVDTTAPRLILSSPLNGSPFHADGTVTVSGITDTDAELWISIDDGPETMLPVTLDADGLFTETVAIPNYNDAAIHILSIYAADPNENRTEIRDISVSHPGLGDLSRIELMVDGAVPENGCISTQNAADKLPLNVTGVTSTGTRFVMDPSRVTWRSFAAEGRISAEDGLSYTAYAKGFVEAMVEVSTGAYLTASIALNAETPNNMVAVSSTMGGRASGGGKYDLGEYVVLSATPEEGYRLDRWEVDGADVSDLSTETIRFVMPGNGVTAKAVFVSSFVPCDGDDCPGNRFTDMPPKSHWAHDAIDFAIVRKLTVGTSETTFSPNGGCTRAQFVTFLWRLSGSPEPTTTSNPFTDVRDGRYYTKPILWAVENQITGGTSATTFSPDDICTRAQCMTFLWRFAGSPEPTMTDNPFTDVPSGKYYTKAVLWAFENRITDGTTETTFSPKNTCTREQTVTFLYRLCGGGKRYHHRSSASPSSAAATETPIRIAFIDSGISTKHIDGSKIANGFNYVFPGSDTEDRIGHGTATASLVLGAADQNVMGAYPDAVAIPLVVVDVYPSGAVKNGGPEALCQAIYDAVDRFGCKIINISLCTTDNSVELRRAAAYAESRGVVLIAAVGNDGENGQRYYPAAYESVVAVGSADGENAAPFSQNGADLLAEDVELTAASNKNGKAPVKVEGTSYSCALVTGVCARLLHQYPELTPKQARSALFALCRDILEPGYDQRSGWGILLAEPEIPYPSWEIPESPSFHKWISPELRGCLTRTPQKNALAWQDCLN